MNNCIVPVRPISESFSLDVFKTLPRMLLGALGEICFAGVLGIHLQPTDSFMILTYLFLLGAHSLPREAAYNGLDLLEFPAF